MLSTLIRNDVTDTVITRQDADGLTILCDEPMTMEAAMARVPGLAGDAPAAFFIFQPDCTVGMYCQQEETP